MKNDEVAVTEESIGVCSVCKDFVITNEQRFYEYKSRADHIHFKEVCYKCFKRPVADRDGC